MTTPIKRTAAALAIAGSAAGVVLGLSLGGGTAQAYPLPTTTTVPGGAPPGPTTTTTLPAPANLPPVPNLPATGGTDTVEIVVAASTLAVAGLGMVVVASRRRSATDSAS